MAIRTSAAHGIFQFMLRVKKDLEARGIEKEIKNETGSKDISRANLGVISRILVPAFKKSLKTVGVPKEVRRTEMGLLDSLLAIFPSFASDLWAVSSLYPPRIYLTY